MYVGVTEQSTETFFDLPPRFGGGFAGTPEPVVSDSVSCPRASIFSVSVFFGAAFLLAVLRLTPERGAIGARIERMESKERPISAEARDTFTDGLTFSRLAVRILSVQCGYSQPSRQPGYTSSYFGTHFGTWRNFRMLTVSCSSSCTPAIRTTSTTPSNALIAARAAEATAAYSNTGTRNTLAQDAVRRNRRAHPQTASPRFRRRRHRQPHRSDPHEEYTLKQCRMRTMMITRRRRMTGKTVKSPFWSRPSNGKCTLYSTVSRTVPSRYSLD